METEGWNLENCPALTGKITVITGANCGLGYETAKVFAQKQAHVILACRNPNKANEARNSILSHFPEAQVTTMEIDLANLNSVRNFVSTFSLKFSHLDFLINNAGVMMPPYTRTDDGFELQYQTNYLGHFLLTGLLLPKLESAPAARVISLSSLAHKWGDIYFDDMQFKNGYEKRKSYGQSKLACLIFAYELDRRLRKSGSSVKSLAAHPGVANTQLARYLPKFLKLLSPIIVPFMTQKAAAGAQPQIRAALDISLNGGTYLGPSGQDEYRGKPGVVGSNKKSKNRELAIQLWLISENHSGMKFLS